MNANEEKSVPPIDQIHISTTLVAGANRRMLARSRNHEIVMDVRKEWGGDNAGPTPPELLVMALGGCILNICRIVAMQKHIVMDDLRISISGDIDPSRAFGIHTDIRAGFSHLKVQVEMVSKLSDEENELFRQELIDRCPLCDSISNPTPLQVTFSKQPQT